MSETRKDEITRVLHDPGKYWSDMNQQKLLDTLFWDEEEREIISGETGIPEEELKEFAYESLQDSVLPPLVLP